MACISVVHSLTGISMNCVAPLKADVSLDGALTTNSAALTLNGLKADVVLDGSLQKWAEYMAVASRVF
jgi:hypothetical protein